MNDPQQSETPRTDEARNRTRNPWKLCRTLELKLNRANSRAEQAESKLAAVERDMKVAVGALSYFKSHFDPGLDSPTMHDMCVEALSTPSAKRIQEEGKNR